MLIPLLQIAFGLLVLFVGGHYMVRGAVAIALLGRISTTVVALTVVSIGTSLPELAVSMDAALRGSTDIAYGNVIGSNIFNVGAILAIAALLAPVPVRYQTLRIEYPIMFVVSCVAVLAAHDGVVDRFDGVFLVVMLAVFLGYMIHLARRGDPLATEAARARELEREAHVAKGAGRAWWINMALLLVGGGALALGADVAVSGAVRAAELFGVEQRVIGLTVMAMGTSLPELATSAVAAQRGEQEIALGNVVGSNIFNLLGILGVTAAVVPVPVHPQALAVDNWVMLAFAAVMLPLMVWGRTVTRWNGVTLLVGFVVYMGYVVGVR